MKETTRKAIAKIVKLWVYKTDYSQHQISELLGSSQPVLSRQLNGIDSMSKNRIQQIINIVNPPKEQIEEVELLFQSTPRLAKKPGLKFHTPVNFSENTTAPNDSELEILKRDAKLAQCRLQIAYLERKVKRLQELNFKEGD